MAGQHQLLGLGGFSLGEEGIDLGKLYDYDIILLDLNLPDMSGYEVLRTLRVAKVKTPILILSGLAGIEDKVKAPSLMVMAEKDAVLPPSAADGMEAYVADLEKVLIKDSGHWTQQEQPEAVNRTILDWMDRRFPK